MERRERMCFGTIDGNLRVSLHWHLRGCCLRGERGFRFRLLLCLQSRFRIPEEADQRDACVAVPLPVAVAHPPGRGAPGRVDTVPPAAPGVLLRRHRNPQARAPLGPQRSRLPVPRSVPVPSSSAASAYHRRRLLR